MLRRNMELKLRLPHLDEARQVARRCATRQEGMQRQEDTYFHCRTGRLKLREIEGQVAQLVWYVRPDTPTARLSSYRLVPVADAAGLKAALADALGIRVAVRKRREIFWYENVRIHLDEVERLGTFLEFEAVLGDADDQQDSLRQLAALADQFGLNPDDRVAGSYADLLERVTPTA